MYKINFILVMEPEEIYSFSMIFINMNKTVPACISLNYHISIRHRNVQVQFPSRGKT